MYTLQHTSSVKSIKKLLVKRGIKNKYLPIFFINYILNFTLNKVYQYRLKRSRIFKINIIIKYKQYVVQNFINDNY